MRETGWKSARREEDDARAAAVEVDAIDERIDELAGVRKRSRFAGRELDKKSERATGKEARTQGQRDPT